MGFLRVYHRTVALSSRAFLRYRDSLFPHMREEWKWNAPAYYSHGKRICLTSGFKDHVTVELFYGAQLRDAQARIVGVGKNTRHMKLKSVKEIDTNYFVDLLQQSIELSQAGTST